MKKLFSATLYLIYIYCTALLIVSCSNDGGGCGEEFTNPENKNENRGNSYSKRIEIPALNSNDIFITHTTKVAGKDNITYSISHNAERKHSRWVAFTFDDSNREIAWQRKSWKYTEWGGDPFQPDPEMPESYVFTKSEINKNGFDRGHLVASYDRVYSKDANEQTFYYSNMSPMYNDFNTGLWSKLEGVVQKHGRNESFCDTLYVVKGGTINPGYYKQVGTCRTVPLYYFMAILSRKNNIYNGIAFWLEHERDLEGTIWDYAMTIDELEEKSGIDFFCNLPDKTENSVERVYYLSKWQ